MACLKSDARPSQMRSKNYASLLKIFPVLLLLCYFNANAQPDLSLKNTLPKEGKLVHNKPVGKGWENMLTSADNWLFENNFWQLFNNSLHGTIGKEKEHHYCYTKKSYKDFELNVMIKMVGDDDANSGVCIRINPTSWDDAPGYQVDMGKGYWGSLWEERRGNMVQKFPDSLVSKIVKKNDWNHYYIIAKGHHIQAWLNGVKTIDIVHDSGFAEGRIGFQLCHLHNPTVVDVKSLYIRGIK
jgi:3-keto-disaccharide hydrolase